MTKTDASVDPLAEQFAKYCYCVEREISQQYLSVEEESFARAVEHYMEEDHTFTPDYTMSDLKRSLLAYMGWCQQNNSYVVPPHMRACLQKASQ